MRIVHFKQIRDFYEKHNQAKLPFLATYQALKEGTFLDNKEILERFTRSSLLKGTKRKIVFRLKGNDYRMIIQFDYSRQIGNIRFVGTHAEYDKLYSQ